MVLMPDRDDAIALLHEWVENEGLRKHMYAVEAAVRFYARKMGADEDLWGLAGLLHDLDWEKHPEVHPMKGIEALKERGYPGEVVQAILAHRPEYTGVEPTADLDRVLYACDEISGLIHAACLMRPTGIDDIKPKSVVKKLKDRAFAAGVDREQVAHGVDLIGLDRNEHIQNVVDGMKEIAEVLGIRGEDLQKG